MEAPVFIAIIIAAAGIGYAMSRVSKVRKEFPDLAAKRPPRVSKRQKRLEQIRAHEPEYTPPSLEDLIAADIKEAGIDTIPGASGVPQGVILKVYRRDEPAIACRHEELRFLVADGVEPGSAGIDDVRLICDVPAEPAKDPSPAAELPEMPEEPGT